MVLGGTDIGEPAHTPPPPRLVSRAMFHACLKLPPRPCAPKVRRRHKLVVVVPALFAASDSANVRWSLDRPWLTRARHPEHAFAAIPLGAHWKPPPQAGKLYIIRSRPSDTADHAACTYRATQIPFGGSLYRRCGRRSPRGAEGRYLHFLRQVVALRPLPTVR